MWVLINVDPVEYLRIDSYALLSVTVSRQPRSRKWWDVTLTWRDDPQTMAVADGQGVTRLLQAMENLAKEGSA